MDNRRPGRWLGGFFAVAATAGLAAAANDIAAQGGAWWQYGAVLCLWLALLAFALVLIPAVAGGLLQRIARARAAAEATAAGRPVEPFLQRTVDPASGIRLPRVLQLLAIAFMALAVLLGTVGGGLAVTRALFLQRAATAEGVVVEMLPQGARPGMPQRPSIRFTAADNVTRTLVSGVETWPPRFSTGDRVAVLYHPARPARAYAADGFDLWFLPALIGGLGAAFMVPALVLFALSVRFAWRERAGQARVVKGR